MLCSKLRYILMSACAIGLLTLPAAVTHADEFVLAPDASISQLQVGSEILIELTNQSESFRVEQTILNDSGSRTIIAKPVDTSRYGFYIATFSEDYTSALINIDGFSYNLDSVGTSGDWYAGAKLSLIEPKVTVTSIGKPTTKTPPLMTELDSRNNIIDIHLHYNNDVRFGYDAGLEARIAHIVNSANYFFADSGVNIRIRARATYQNYLNYALADIIFDYQNWGSSTRAVKNLRSSSGYDAVFLLSMRTRSGAACYEAPLGNPLTENYVDYAISAFALNCADEVLAESIARTLGIQSSHFSTDAVPSPFEEGYGHGVVGEFYTLVADRTDFDVAGTLYPRKYYRFSSPLLDCGGVACGVPTGEPNAADSVSVLNAVAAAAAQSNEPISDRRRYTEIEDRIVDFTLKSCLNSYKLNQSSYISTWTDPFECENRTIENLAGLSEFYNFTSIDLMVDSFTENLAEIEKLTQLRELTLVSLNLPTDESIDIGNLTKLEYLELQNIGLRSLDNLNLLSNLKELRISNREISFRDVKSLSGLKSLREIHLENVNFSDLSLLSSLTQLDNVSIMSAGLTDLLPLASWDSRPRTMNFSMNSVRSLSGLAVHQQLLSLVMHQNQGLADISALSTHTQLEHLELAHANLSNLEGISGLSKLRTLWLRGPRVDSIEGLPSLDDIYQLSLEFGEVDDAAPVLLKMPEIVENANVFGEQALFGFLFTTAPCWQYDYRTAYSSMHGIDLTLGKTCLEVGRYFDYDDDGIINQDEIDRLRNPLVAESLTDFRPSFGLFDWNQDRISEIGLFNPLVSESSALSIDTNGAYSLSMTTVPEDIPLYSDYDGDGVTDIIFYRPSTQTWLIHLISPTGTVASVSEVSFGSNDEEIPFIGDYDGDGKADLIVFQDGEYPTFRIQTTSVPTIYGDFVHHIRFGYSLDVNIPFVGDFTGDGKLDVGLLNVARIPQYGIRSISSNFLVAVGGIDFRDGDILVVGDFDGDRVSDVGLRRPSEYLWIINSSIRERDGFYEPLNITFGRDVSDIPIIADYDGDGVDDIAVRRPSEGMQFILNSSGEPGPSRDGIQRIPFGDEPSSIPFAAPISIKMKMLAEQQ